MFVLFYFIDIIRNYLNLLVHYSKYLFILLFFVLLSGCATEFHDNNTNVSVVIEGRTQQQVVDDLSLVVKHFKYYLFSETDEEVVFVTHPEQSNVEYYLRYDENYKNNLYSGFRNRKVKLPHYQMIFRFSRVDKGLLVEASIKYTSWKHGDEVNVNYREGILIQKILNELQYNSRLDSVRILYSRYRTVYQFLERGLATFPPNETQQRVTYIRRIVMSHVDADRQLKALTYVREKLKKYCNFNNGVFKESKNKFFYTAQSLNVSEIIFASVKKAGKLKSFGVKNCQRNGRTVWQLIIQAKSIQSVNIHQSPDANRPNQLRNPEIYLVVNVLK